MRKILILVIIVFFWGACSKEEPAGTDGDYPFQPVEFTKVHFTDDFWLPRLDTNRLVTIPYDFDKHEGARVELNTFNSVSFVPVKTDAVKLKINLQQDYFGGILERKIQ